MISLFINLLYTALDRLNCTSPARPAMPAMPDMPAPLPLNVITVIMAIAIAIDDGIDKVNHDNLFSERDSEFDAEIDDECDA